MNAQSSAPSKSEQVSPQQPNLLLLPLNMPQYLTRTLTDSFHSPSYSSAAAATTNNRRRRRREFRVEELCVTGIGWKKEWCITANGKPNGMFAVAKCITHVFYYSFPSAADDGQITV